MTKRNKNLVGVIFIGMILSVMLYFMKEGMTDGVLSEVIPIAFLAFVSIAIAGVASFLFSMIENNLSVEHPLGNGRLTLGGGAAVFFATLVILLYAGGYFFAPNDANASNKKPVASFSISSNAYFSTYEDGRTIGLSPTEAQIKLTRAFDSPVALELIISFVDISGKPVGFDVDAIRGELVLPTSNGTRTEPITWVCKGGTRDLDNLRNPEADWQNCPISAAKFSVGKEVLSEDYLFRAENYPWKSFLADMLRTPSPRSEVRLEITMSQRGEPGAKITSEKRCGFSNNDLKFFVPNADASNPNRKIPQFGIPLTLYCQE